MRKTITFVTMTLAVGVFVGCDSGDEEEKTCDPGAGIACVYMGTGVAGLGADDFAPRETELYLPQDTTVGADNLVYVVDWNNHRIRQVRDGVTHTVVGTGYLGDAPDGTATEIPLNHPTHLTALPDGALLISAWHNSKVLRFDPAAGTSAAVCGTGMRAFGGDGGPAAMGVLDLPVATALGSDGSVYIADQANQRIRKITPDDMINTYAGDGVKGFLGDGGPALEAQVSLPGGQSAPPAGRIAVDGDDNLYIADSGNHRIRKVDAEGTITTFVGNGTPTYAGDGGPAADASLSRPSDVEVADDGTLYIADTDNSCIRAVSPDGNISTVAGVCGTPGPGEEGVLATEMLLDRPYGIELGPEGTLLIADTHNHRIVQVWPEE